MKIYSNTTDNTKFDQFIGKDLWVRCKYSFTPGTVEHYIRFLKRYENYVYVMDISCPEYDNRRSYLQINTPYEDVHTFYVGQIEIVQPLETYTTSQLFPKYAELTTIDNYSDTIFNKFMGNDFWVLVTKYDAQDWQWYMRISDRTGDSIMYDLVDAEYIHNPEISEDSYGPPTEDPSVNSYRLVSLAGVWRVVQPLDGLSGDEMEEALDICDDIWEKAHENDDEDEEYEDEDYEE